MYANFYYLFKDLFGIEWPFLMIINSFGFFVAISFVLANLLFAYELKRKEKQGLIKASIKKTLIGKPASIQEIALSSLLGFIIGFKLFHIILNFSDFTKNTQEFILSLEGNVLGGIVLAVYMGYTTYRDKEKSKLETPQWTEQLMHPHEHVGNMTMIAAIAGIIGAKVFHNLENINDLMNDPVNALLSFSGLTMYGGLIVGSAAVIWYAKKNNLSILHLIDACAPGLMLAYGTGRIGCQIAGDGDWGIVNLSEKPRWLNIFPDWVWSYNYPGNVIHDGIPIPGCEGEFCNMLAHPVFPTPFYEAVTCIFLFGVIWYCRKFFTVPGMIFSFYLILNGLERFWIEKIRINEVYQIGTLNITQAEIISALLFLTGVISMIYLKKRNKKTNSPVL